MDAIVDLLPRWTQQDWMADAACRGHTELFFPPGGERPPARIRRERAAEELCASCPVRRSCLTYARTHREHGYWGGESEDERVLAGYSPSHPVGRTRLRAAAG